MIGNGDGQEESVCEGSELNRSVLQEGEGGGRGEGGEGTNKRARNTI